MAFYTIEKKNIKTLLGDLLKEFTLIAPIKKKEITSFEVVQDPEEVTFTLRNTDRPPKGSLFPQNEVFFSYKEGQIEEEKIEGRSLLFGVRPCDAKSFVLLDRVFEEGDFEDTYYKERRKRTTIFGLSCNEPQDCCFCTSFDTGPFSKEGMDVFMVDLGEMLLLESITEEGEKIICKQRLDEASSEDVKRIDELKERAPSRIQDGFNHSILNERLSVSFDDPIWAELHLRCMGCGVCTFFCPTCHCFDVVDEGGESCGRRIRIWDSCQFALFTLHASGHQPRETTKERFRQRIMHKFNYFTERFKEPACVGCGRCVLNCPVNLDMKEVLKRFLQ